MAEVITINFGAREINVVREDGVRGKIDFMEAYRAARAANVEEGVKREETDVEQQGLEAKAWEMHKGIISVRLRNMRTGEKSTVLYSVPCTDEEREHVREELKKRKATLDRQYPDYAFTIERMLMTTDFCLTARRVGEASVKSSQNYKDGRGEDLQEHSA